jgi:hypothetical protein
LTLSPLNGTRFALNECMKSLVITLILFVSWSLQAQDSTSVEPIEGVSTNSWDSQRQAIMQRLVNFDNFSYGPNCWNSALLVSGLAESIRYVDGSEFWHWMNSDYCEALPQGAELQYGDIGSVYGTGRDHYHSFMRINDDRIFHKASPQVDHRWTEDRYERIAFPMYFNETTQCKGNESTQMNANCERRVVYHRCQPRPTDFYSRYPDLRNLDREVQGIETSLEAWMQEPSNTADFNRSMIRLSEMLHDIDQQRFSGEKEFAREAMAFRIAGLLQTDSPFSSLRPAQVQHAQFQSTQYFNRYRPTLERAGAGPD